jgi:aldose 1-epimerase
VTGQPATPGERLELALGTHRAEIVTTGARLRRLVLHGVEITAPDPGPPAADDEYWGVVLAPWPNRLQSGALLFEDREYRFELNDPVTATALHGTFTRAPFEVASRAGDRLELRAGQPLEPPAWPSSIVVSATYQLVAAGLAATVSVLNVGPGRCPAGLGVHPYLSPGGALDACGLSIPANRRLIADTRLLPAGEVPHPAGRLDLDGLPLDTAFGGLARDADGITTTTLHRADGRDVEIWAGPSARWFQVFTCDTLPPPRTRAAIAIEPMTCQPDGLNRDGGDVLEPGQGLTLRWGIGLRGASGTG